MALGRSKRLVLGAALHFGCGASVVGGGGGGEAGQGGDGGSAPPSTCEPGTVVACYDGHEDTEGVGPCSAGVRTCTESGDLGPCSGQTLPEEEKCGNEIDDDCNGVVDDGCACTPGDVQSCYSGPPATASIGVCAPGVHVCDTDGLGFGPCAGEVLPGAEDCASPVDDDCDGEVNEGCPCAPGEPSPCYTGPLGTAGVGVCSAGVQVCEPSGLGYGPCEGEVLPVAESCATLEDDDCDGGANEGCVCTPGVTEVCYTGPPGTMGVGQCQGGMKTCDSLGLGFGPCVGEVTPQPEVCETMVDEDCDGLATPCPASTICSVTFPVNS
ncbi:MAG: MopE-related protein, partial [Polyangiaceae bacterium]